MHQALASAAVFFSDTFSPYAAGQINLTSATWPVGGVTIATGRQVLIFAGESTASPNHQIFRTALGTIAKFCFADDESSTSVLDFGGLTSAINVQIGGRIEFRGIAIRQPAPQRWAIINDTYLVNTAFAALPSINTAPNATVSNYAQACETCVAQNLLPTVYHTGARMPVHVGGVQ